MAAPLGRDTLPDHWSYGVCRDGRVFFINDKTRSTTWLHPRTGEPVNSGHMIRSDLPRGWEEGFTDEGASYFINHNQRTTAFRHPVTGQISPENSDYILQEPSTSRMSKPPPDHRPPSMVSETSTAVTTSTVDVTSGSKTHGLLCLSPCLSQVARSSGKVHSFGKREQAIKRNPNMPVVVRGWLYKQDSSGMRLWKRKWFVLSDYCLFYYKDSREETVLGSIPLPSYVISPVEHDDHISRKYAFKATHTGMRSYIYNKNSVIGSQAEHGGMRTYYFSADTQEDMNGWIRAMNQAALMQSHTAVKREVERPDKQEQLAVPQTNHINSCSSKSPVQHETHYPAEMGEGPSRGELLAERAEAQARVVVEVDVDDLSPESTAPPSRPSSYRPNGHPPGHGGPIVAPLEQNGGVVYQRGRPQRPESEKTVQRKTALAQVEHWVKVQKGDPKSHATTEYSLPRRTPPTQPKAGILMGVDTYQSLPKTLRHPASATTATASTAAAPTMGSPQAPRNLPSDYKYAQDRLSHFRMTTDERVASREGMVWQLYEWQQRQQFRHGSPTAPIYSGPDYLDSAGASFRVTLEVNPYSFNVPKVPRSISVPPSPCEVPPSAPSSKPLSPRRPHTPSDRVTVRPLNEVPLADHPVMFSPRRPATHLSKTAQMERRSVPTMGYITHTVSAPSLHGKTADDTYMQLKKDLEYLDLKVTGRETLKDRPARPVKIAESDIDVKLSRLCEQDKILQELEMRIRTLKEDKDKLESVLDVSHQQMEEYRDQPAHADKIAYQQRLLQEDVVHIRAEISQLSTCTVHMCVCPPRQEMENAWSEYRRLEEDVDRLRAALQEQMSRCSITQQEKAQLRKELWRIEDVMAGLSSSKANYKITVDSVQNPERKLVPSVSSSVPSISASPSAGQLKSLTHSPSQPLPTQQPLLPTHDALLPAAGAAAAAAPQSPKWAEEGAPPRPPLPQLYSPDEHPPEVPPLPRETSVIRHTSVRGLKRQSDERKRDREVGQYTNGDKVEIRAFLSEPELHVGGVQTLVSGYQTLPSRGGTGSTTRLNQSSNISSYVTLRRGASAPGLKERPKSALERLYSGEPCLQRGGRMSAEEQLERMKRHQKALVRERKRTLSQGERHASTSSVGSTGSAPAAPGGSGTTTPTAIPTRPGSGSGAPTPTRPVSADLGSWKREQDFDMQLLERAVQGEERPAEHRERPRSQSDEWLTLRSMKELDMEPLDYNIDLSRELSKPKKVEIPERYVDMEPEEPLSPQEIEARHRKVERIKSILAKSSVQNLPPTVVLDKCDLPDLDSAMQEQERIITMSYALASEASLKSKQVAAKAVFGH
ncbi:pleckstrin homology domain-containing family A member 7 isoform X2 [Engraulis encrasicolus]|uniref:pleckstrin homology domain-containing family A member 7 isoform X2 n=1 Tax=Engraulis encrasicolus TaxID=184585 RepID=UPI002FD3D22C